MRGLVERGAQTVETFTADVEDANGTTIRELDVQALTPNVTEVHDADGDLQRQPDCDEPRELTFVDEDTFWAEF